MIPFAGFDVNLQAARAALNRTVDGFLAALLAKGQTTFNFNLPTLTLGFATINLGRLTVEVDSGRIVALRPVGTTHHGVEADFDVTGRLALAGVTATITILGGTTVVPLPPISADLDIAFRGVDLDLDVTAHGIPDALILGLKHANLAGINATNVQPPQLGPLLATLLNLITIVLQAGFSLAAALVPSIPIVVKPLIDAFSLFGLRLHRTNNPTTDSPFITELGPAPNEALVVATDFERVFPPPAGNANRLATLLAPGQNIAVALDTGIINQGLDLAMMAGFVPSVFPGGGFTFHVKWMSVGLLGAQSASNWAQKGGFNPAFFANPASGTTLGAIQVQGELRAKRGHCWCQVKVKIFMDAVFWPYVDVSQAPVPGPVPPGALVQSQKNVHLRLFFDALFTVQVSGFLIMLIDILFGPILIPLLFLVSQIANAVISSYLPYTRNINLLGPTNLQLTANSASVNAFITFALDFNIAGTVQGQGDVTLDQFTHFQLVDDNTFRGLAPQVKNRVDVKVDYEADSISIEDGVIRLAANLIR